MNQNINKDIWNRIHGKMINQIRHYVISRERWCRIKSQLYHKVNEQLFDLQFNQIISSIRIRIHEEQKI